MTAHVDVNERGAQRAELGTTHGTKLRKKSEIRMVGCTGEAGHEWWDVLEMLDL